MVTKTREEWDEMTPAERREHLILEEKNVFGHDVKHDRHGNPVEQGLGGPLQPTAQHVEALRVYYKGPDRDEVIASETKRLHEYQAKQNEERRSQRRRGAD